ncbi:uncharacterized protein LOC127686471 [Apodemus sylvaticus]|uniref:uncharacterized protein LOC127686471 n=1 Tax=Apodemus sylvaticus TaxID=10129 RepID=UPI00224474B4|nr:uncharacterized protein LOC127686471 [Apodemus sylvaticus]
MRFHPVQYIHAARGQEHKVTMVTMQVLLLTVVLILPSVENLSFRNPEYSVTVDKLLGKWYITRWAGNPPIPAKKKFSPLPPFIFVKNILGKLEFRMNISKPMGCVVLKMNMEQERENSGIFYIWPNHRINIAFIGGMDFAIAYHQSNINNQLLKMTMLMGKNMTPRPTVILDFEDFVEFVQLKRTDIINPGFDDSCELFGET